MVQRNGNTHLWGPTYCFDSVETSGGAPTQVEKETKKVKYIKYLINNRHTVFHKCSNLFCHMYFEFFALH